MVQSCNCLSMELQVVATTGAYHTLIVNEKGKLYITSGADGKEESYVTWDADPLFSIYRDYFAVIVVIICSHLYPHFLVVCHGRC